jgi:hypothetical protein
MEYAGTYVLKQMDCVMTKNQVGFDSLHPLHFTFPLYFARES